MNSSGELERSEGACACRSWLGVAGAWACLALPLEDSRECDARDGLSSLLILLGGMSSGYAVGMRRRGRCAGGEY
jgi:hypothetical protein